MKQFFFFVVFNEDNRHTTFCLLFQIFVAVKWHRRSAGAVRRSQAAPSTNSFTTHGRQLGDGKGRGGGGAALLEDLTCINLHKNAAEEAAEEAAAPRANGQTQDGESGA